MYDRGDGDAGVEDLVKQELLGAGALGEGGGAEIEEAENVGEHRQVGDEGEERDEPGDVPGVVGAEEEHKGCGEGGGGAEEGGLIWAMSCEL